jgi:hypothetical protein
LTLVAVPQVGRTLGSNDIGGHSEADSPVDAAGAVVLLGIVVERDDLITEEPRGF